MVLIITKLIIRDNMKYLNELSELNLFKYEDVVNITGNEKNAQYVLKAYISKGLISKIKKNYYAMNDLVNSTTFANKYQIACGYNENDFISHHSVFEYYGAYNQVYNTVDITTNINQKDFSFDGYDFIYHKSDNQIEVNLLNGIRISSIERAIVDCINDSKDFEYYELLECISNINNIQINKIINYLDSLNIKLLYKKVGYVLSKFKDKFQIDNEFFIYCKEKAGNSRGYYDASKKELLVYNSKWELYVYKDQEVS